VPAATPSSQVVEIDGLKFHYLDWGGDGPPLLMLHGFTGHAHTWDKTGAALSDRYRGLALDQRGHGDTDWAPVYGTRPMVDDVARFLDALGIDRVALMGLSMGGMVSYLFAASHPDRIERLIILDIGPEIDRTGMKRITASLGEPDVFDTEDQAVAQARADNPRPTDADLYHRVSHNLRKTGDGKLTYKWDKALRDGSAAREDHTSAEQWDAWRNIRSPILLVRGDDSDILSEETAKRMLEENPNAHMVTVADCGHSITLDRPEGLIELCAPRCPSPSCAAVRVGSTRRGT
jgi:pimeloyl-ACP methyl ester carboxylesterase